MLPVIKTPITAKGVLAVVVSSMVDHVHVYSSDLGAKLSLDGQPPIDLPADGVDLSSVAAGAHELTLSHGGEPYRLAIDVTTTPALTGVRSRSECRHARRRDRTRQDEGIP